MKEVTSIAGTFLAKIPEPGKRFEAEVEVALAISEIIYRIGTTGQLQKERAVETVRFVATAKTLREIADNLSKYAAEAESELAEALSNQTT